MVLGLQQGAGMRGSRDFARAWTERGSSCLDLLTRGNSCNTRSFVGKIVGRCLDASLALIKSTRDDPEVYEPFLQRPVPSFSILVRATSDPNTLASALRSTVVQMDVELPLAHIMSMPALSRGFRREAGFRQC